MKIPTRTPETILRPTLIAWKTASVHVAALMTLTASLLSSPSASAAIQSTFVYTKQNLTVVDRRSLEQLQAGKDAAPIEKMTLSMGVIDKNRGATRLTSQQIDQAVNDISVRLPSIFEAAVQRSLQGIKFTKDESADGRTVLHIQDSLTFYERLVHEGSVEERIVANALLSDYARKEEADYGERLGIWLQNDTLAEGLLFDADQIDSADLAKLQKIATDQHMKIARFDKILIIGNGFAFYLMKNVLEDGARLTDPVQKRKFTRVMQNLARKNIPVKMAQNQGAAAFYDPTSDTMAIVMPGHVGLNTLTHEGTHARFARLQKQLEKWIDAKGYATPYQIDGPFAGFSRFGGYLTLLNELNSWRIGNSFDGPANDQEILKTLTDFYGSEAGADATEFFSKYWTPDRVAGKSVPALLLGEVRALNSMSAYNSLKLGLSKDETKQVNFIRLTLARGNNGPVDKRAAALLLRLQANGVTTRVKDESKSALSQLKLSAPASVSEQEQLAEFQKIKALADKWVADVEQLAQDKKWILTSDFKNSKVEFAAAASWNINNYEELTARFKSTFGSDYFEWPGFKTYFENVVKAPGATLAEKLNSYVENWNKQGIDSLLPDFVRTKDRDLGELLKTKYAQELKAPHLQALMAGAIAEHDTSKQQIILDVISTVFDLNGFPVQYGEASFTELAKEQLALNQQNHLPETSNMPVKRAHQPNHWLLAAVDAVSSQSLMNGQPSSYRMQVVNLLRDRSFPDELPLTRDRVLKSLFGTTDAEKNDSWIAQEFLGTGNQGYYEHSDWGLLISDTVLHSPDATVRAKEMVAEFIRLTLGSELSYDEIGTYEGDGYRDDVVARAKALTAMKSLSSTQSNYLKWGQQAAWTLLQDPSSKVRRSAIYAIAAHPVLFISLEDKILEAVSSWKGDARTTLLELALLSEPGFLPKLDTYLASSAYKRKFANETKYLELRLDPTVTQAGSTQYPVLHSGQSCRDLFGSK